MGGSVLDLFAKLTLDSSAYNKGLDDAKNKGSGFASFLGGIGKASVAAFTAVGTATAVMGKQAIDAFGNYEQLWGGVQKLYGDSANTVLKNAEQAFMTSGQNINDYMEQATSLSAALINSLGNDTQKAAEQTDVAMRAISDNYNTFGGDLQNVAGVFQALSKQQYQTLDNLKLGYAGTKSGMEQLIADANEWGAANGKASDLSIDSFSDVVTAIDYIQQKMGIAGTTQNEAMKTLEGSSKATKAAWDNVIAAIGKGEGIQEAFEGLITTIFGENEGEGFLAQITSAISRAMEGAGEFLVQAVPIILERIPEVIGAVLPPLLNTTGEVLNSIIQYLLANIPEIVSTGVQLLSGLAQGIKNNLPEMMTTIALVISEIIREIMYELPDIISAGWNILLGLAEGLGQAIPIMLDVVGEMIDRAWHAITNFNWGNIGRNIIQGIANGISGLGHIIGDRLMSIARNAWSAVKSFFGIASPSKLMRDSIGRYIPLGMAEGIEDEADSVYDAMDDLNNGAMDSFDTVFDDISTSKVGGLGGNHVEFGGFTFNIYGAEGQDPEEIAMAVRDIIISEEERNKLVYA